MAERETAPGIQVELRPISLDELPGLVYRTIEEQLRQRTTEIVGFTILAESPGIAEEVRHQFQQNRNRAVERAENQQRALQSILARLEEDPSTPVPIDNTYNTSGHSNEGVFALDQVDKSWYEAYRWPQINLGRNIPSA